MFSGCFLHAQLTPPNLSSKGLPRSGLLKPKLDKSHHVPAIILVEFSHSAGNGKVAAELQRSVQLIAGIPAALIYGNRKYSPRVVPIVEGMRGAVLGPRGCSTARHGGQEVSITPTSCLGRCGAVESLCPAKDSAASSAPDGWVRGATRTPGKDIAVCCDLNVPRRGSTEMSRLSSQRDAPPNLVTNCLPGRRLLAFSLLF